MNIWRRGKSFIKSWKFLGLIALIMVSGIGMMTMMSLQVTPVLEGTFIAHRAEVKYHRTLYQVSDYKAGYNLDGDPYMYDLVCYEGSSINITLIPKVLAVDSVYLMCVSDLYWGINDQGPVDYLSTFGKWMKNPDKDVIKIVEYDISGNVVPLGVIDIPESDYSHASWRLICFCKNMGYNGGSDNNPDGKVIIDIVIV